jgi:hypothetical protein
MRSQSECSIIFRVKTMLADINAKLERIFSNRQPRTTVYIRIVMVMVLEEYFATLKNLVAMSTKFPHQNFHKYT